MPHISPSPITPQTPIATRNPLAEPRPQGSGLSLNTTSLHLPQPLSPTPSSPNSVPQKAPFLRLSLLPRFPHLARPASAEPRPQGSGLSLNTTQPFPLCGHPLPPVPSSPNSVPQKTPFLRLSLLPRFPHLAPPAFAEPRPQGSGLSLNTTSLHLPQPFPLCGHPLPPDL